MNDEWKVRTEQDDGFWTEVSDMSEDEARKLYEARRTMLRVKGEYTHTLYRNGKVVTSVTT